MNCPLCKGTMKPGNTHVNQAVGNDGLIVPYARPCAYL